MVNKKRLADTFMALVKIDSVSKEEAELAREIKKNFKSLGAEVLEDNSARKVGGDSGNLIVKFKGNVSVEPLLLNAHMDTVEPGRRVMPILNEGIFSTNGDTILGADDKSAIAVLIEMMNVIKENNIANGPIEIVLTVCEEIGLMGAKNLDLSLLTSKFGYTLDATDTEGIVIKAPAANGLEFKVHGKDAHAGAAPEKGINAISLAAKAIAALDIGRIDRETTCNIGVIQGGNAINIVPSLVTVKGEVRSHDKSKLDMVTNTVVSSFEDVVNNYINKDIDNNLPRIEVSIEKEFPNTNISEDHPAVILAQKAAKNLGRNMRTKITGGGADANIFFEKGIVTGVLGTGMRDMHTVRESVDIEDMVRATELLIEIIKLHSNAF